MASNKRTKKGVKLSEKSLKTRMENKKARKRNLVRFMEQQSTDSQNR